MTNAAKTPMLGGGCQYAALRYALTDAEMSADRRQRYVNFQYPDHGTPPDWPPPRR
jgi:hypothetical protein